MNIWFWTERDSDTLTKEYAKGTPLDEIRLLLDAPRSLVAVTNRTSQLGIHRPGYHWTDKETAILREEWPEGTSMKEIMKKISGSTQRIRQKASALGLRRPPVWTDEKTTSLKRLYSEGLDLEEICSVLNLDKLQVRAKRSILKLHRPVIWPEGKVQRLKSLREQGYSYEKIAKILNHSYAAISDKCRRLQLKTNTKSFARYEKFELQGIEILKSLGKKDVKRTHEHVSGQEPADATYLENNVKVGVNIKSGEEAMSITSSNLARLKKDFKIIEFLWVRDDGTWDLFRHCGEGNV